MILNKYIKNINIYLKCGIIILQKSKKEVVEMIIKLDTDSQQTKLINEYLENKELNLIGKMATTNTHIGNFEFENCFMNAAGVYCYDRNELEQVINSAAGTFRKTYYHRCC